MPDQNEQPEKQKPKSAKVIALEELQEEHLQYYPPYLVAFSLPIKPVKVTVKEKNKSPQIKYQSKIVLENGPYQLKLIADEDYGHPFGKDRLFLAWLFSQSVKTRSKYLYYPSIRKLLAEMGLAYSKPNRDWLHGVINRVKNCSLQYSYSNETICATRNEHILTTVVGPLDPKKRKKADKSNKRDLTKYKSEECFFELSNELYAHLVESSVPFDIRVINELGDHYGAIDLYLFWSWRNFRLFEKKEGAVNILIAQLQKHMSAAKDLKKWSQQLSERNELVKKAIVVVYGKSDVCRMDVLKNKTLSIRVTKPLIKNFKKINQQQEIENKKELDEPEADSIEFKEDKEKFEAVRRKFAGLAMPTAGDCG